MSLLDGLILHTLDQVNKVSQHSMLMRFYKLEKKIQVKCDTQSCKQNFHDLNLYFMYAEARAILKALDIV